MELRGEICRLQEECHCLRAEVERLTAEIEDWRSRLAAQCGQTLAARYERDEARAALEPKL
jgi:predicted RNase H-like nuclease (RuvC/YqgF family)